MLRKKTDDEQTVRQFQSETAAIREAAEPWTTRVTVFALTGLLLSATAVIFIAKVDRVIISSGGKIVPTQQVNVFQALDASIIKTLDVREGEQVRTGTQLGTLDPTFAEADVHQLRQQIASLEAQNLRNEAELSGRPLVFPVSKDEDFKKYSALQRALYDQRVAQYQAQMNSFRAKIDQAQATVLKFAGDEKRYQQREEIAQKIETMRTTLADQGLGSVLNKLSSQDARLELLRSVENNRNGLTEAQHALASAKADQEAFSQNWSSQLSQELVKGRNDLDSARSQFEKATKHHDLVRLTAPEDSVVLTVAKLSVGSVLKPGDALFTLMPLNTPLEAEVRIATRDVAFIRPRDPCALKIDAFNYIEHGTASGTLRWISEGAFTVDDNGQSIDPYYKARCSVDTAQLVNAPPNFRLIPGMTLTAEVNVGTHSIATYLLGGLVRGIGEAMREP